MWEARLTWDMANCPYCDYEGRVGSVEAHISGKCDDAHKGKVGQGFRESLPQLPDDDQPEPDSPDESDGPPSISPGWAFVGATMLVVVLVIVTAPTVDESEPVEDDRDGQPDGWA